jgi:hypothetical protein
VGNRVGVNVIGRICLTESSHIRRNGVEARGGIRGKAERAVPSPAPLLHADAIERHHAMRHSANALRVDRIELAKRRGDGRPDPGDEFASSHR